MNKKVLRTMITLVVVFLVALYVLKIFFPEQFVMAIQNEKFVAIGSFIDQRQWLTLAVSGLTTFIIYWLYICAVTRKWKLNKKELILVLLSILISRLLCLYDVDLCNGLSTICMFIIPAISGAELKDLAVVYSVHYFSQLLSLKIRNLPILLININSVIAIFMTIECYFWLLLFYVYNNYKRKI